MPRHVNRELRAALGRVLVRAREASGLEGLICDHLNASATGAKSELDRWEALELARPDGTGAVYFCCAFCRKRTQRKLPTAIRRNNA